MSEEECMELMQDADAVKFCEENCLGCLDEHNENATCNPE